MPWCVGKPCLDDRYPLTFRLPYLAGCFAITTVFSHAQTVVLCAACGSVLCQPTGGKARLTEGTFTPRCETFLGYSSYDSQDLRTVGRTEDARSSFLPPCLPCSPCSSIASTVYRIDVPSRFLSRLKSTSPRVMYSYAIYDPPYFPRSHWASCAFRPCSLASIARGAKRGGIILIPVRYAICPRYAIYMYATTSQGGVKRKSEDMAFKASRLSSAHPGPRVERPPGCRLQQGCLPECTSVDTTYQNNRY